MQNPDGMKQKTLHLTIKTLIHSQTAFDGLFFSSESLNIRVSPTLLLNPLIFSFYPQSLVNPLPSQGV